MKPTTLRKKYLEYQAEVKEYKAFNLKAQKIELGLAQDLDKSVSKSEGFVKNSKKIIESIEKAAKSYTDMREKTRKQSSEIEEQISSNNRIIKAAETAAKELGVNVNDIKGVALLEKSNKDLEREMNLLKYPAIR